MLPKTLERPANGNQAVSQAEATGNTFHSHPILVEDGNLTTASLDSGAARVVGANTLCPRELAACVSSAWQDRE